MGIYLETERIRLREFDENDEENLFDLDSDPEVMRFLTNGVTTPRDQVKGMLDRIITMNKKHGGRFGYWAAIEKETGFFLGWFLFRPARRDPDNVKRIEIGYRLKKMAWGKGYATEVSKQLVKKGFTELDVEEIFALAMKSHAASQHVMKKCGLVFNREFFNDDYPDSVEPDVEYVLPRSAYRNEK